MFFHPEIETEDSIKSEQSLVVEISTQTEVGSGRKNLLTRLNLFGKVIEAAVTSTNGISASIKLPFSANGNQIDCWWAFIRLFRAGSINRRKDHTPCLFPLRQFSIADVLNFLGNLRGFQ